MENPADEPPSGAMRAARPERVWPSALVATVLVVLDGWYYIPGPGLLLCMVFAIAGLLIALFRFLRRNRSPRPALLKFIFYGTAVAIIAQLLSWQEVQARDTAARVIVAVNQFHADTGLWPRALAELVPARLTEIPPVNMRHDNRFHYVNEEGRVALAWYVALPTSYWQHDFMTGRTELHD